MEIKERGGTARNESCVRHLLACGVQHGTCSHQFWEPQVIRQLIYYSTPIWNHCSSRWYAVVKVLNGNLYQNWVYNFLFVIQVFMPDITDLVFLFVSTFVSAYSNNLLYLPAGSLFRYSLFQRRVLAPKWPTMAPLLWSSVYDHKGSKFQKKSNDCLR